ncbi:hypothetical protein IBL26_13285 [Roseomonas aerophila]|uniref:Uncharacterized protein n=1 Tax=Teichococcus aerophilus TaxID=1224513 RepID=A0ABR7RN18_9PROT|nr:hypothetical protein [Pseudoroseomonas aerophila]MBC9207813.1 hypothetical protein [Pseudoroseomonas aerophila]
MARNTGTAFPGRRAGLLLATAATLALAWPAGAALAQRGGPQPRAEQGPSKSPGGNPGGGNQGGACRPNPDLRIALQAADAASAPPLQPGRAVCLTLRRGQSAYFRVAAEAGSHYTVTTRRLSGETDTVLALLNRAGRTVSGDDDGGREPLSSLLEVGPELEPGLVRAGTLQSQGGTFEVIVTRSAAVPPPDFPVTLDGARAGQPLAAGETRHLRLRRQQAAFFALPEELGSLAATTTNLRGDTDTVLAVVDADGRVLAEDDDGGEGFASDLPLAGLAAGPLFLRVTTLDGSAGEFDLTLRREAPQAVPDFPTSLSAARERPPLAADSTTHLVLRRRQAAFFALPPGQDLIALTRNLRRQTDTVLALLDADGAVLLEDDDGGGGFASRLATRSAGGHAAFLRVQTLDGSGGGEFDLVLRSVGARSGQAGGVAGTIEQARQRPSPVVGEAVAVTLEAGEAGVFSLPYDGRPLVAMTFGLGQGTDTVLELLDADGGVLDTNDDIETSLASRLEIGAEPRPAFLRVRQVGNGPAEFQLVLIRPSR